MLGGGAHVWWPEIIAGVVTLKDRVAEEVAGMEGDGGEKCTRRLAEEGVPSKLGIVGKR